MNRKLSLAWGGTLAVAVTIAIATLAPVSAGSAPGADKLVHMAAFACLAIPLAWARPAWALWVALAAIGYGGAIELIQPSFERRAEATDLLADALGASLGAVIAARLGRRGRTGTGG